MMALAAGLALAAAIIVSARLIGFDRDASFYPTVLIVIAWLYVLFAAIDGRLNVIAVEALTALSFCVIAVFGYKGSTWWLAAGYALHGGFDVLHPALVGNTGVPGWWPELCLAVDGAIAVFLALGIRQAATLSRKSDAPE